MDRPKEKIEELFGKLQNSQATHEEKVVILKMINNSIKEFNQKLKELNSVPKNKHTD